MPGLGDVVIGRPGRGLDSLVNQALGHGCLQILFSRGVCGAAARTREVQLVADVEAFEGHIACASSTNSELVLPVFDGIGDLIAVFDIDSDQPDAFTQEDADALASILAEVFQRCNAA